jgi:pimeloyl-ACP methyl ester carboxylesterase
VATAVPDRDKVLLLPDGRRLAWAEFGDLSGSPVVLMHGNPGSRLMCPDLEATIAAGVRLITFDRPGIGGSDPRPFHRLADVADDLAHLAAALKLDPCPLVGWSAGGPFALATSVFRPELATSVTLVAGSGLPDDPDLPRTPEVKAMIDRLRDGSMDAFDQVLERFAFYADDPDGMVARILDKEGHPDQALMQRPDVQAAFTAKWREGARQGAAGVAASWVAMWALPWGFTPEDVPVPVTWLHGTADDIVPYVQAERLAARLPHVTMHTLEGEGHSIAIPHWAEILASV